MPICGVHAAGLAPTRRAPDNAPMTATTAPPSSPPWERIAHDLSDALIYADRSGTIHAWNAAAQALFGFSAEEALGQSLDLIIPPHLREAHWRGFHRAIERGAAGSRAARTTRGVHQDGRKLYVEMSFCIVTDGQGQVLGSAAVARDVTQRQMAARQAAAGEG